MTREVQFLICFGCCLAIGGCPGDDDTFDDDVGDDDIGDDDTADAPTTGSVQGGLTWVRIVGFGQAELVGSNYATDEGGGSLLFDYTNEGSPDDGPGLVLIFDAETGMTYDLAASEGSAEEEEEWMELTVTVDGYDGPGEYAEPSGSVEFSWRADFDYQHDYQQTFVMGSDGDGECLVTVGADPLTGSFECQDVYPVIDGGHWIANAFSMEGGWEAQDVPFR